MDRADWVLKWNHSILKEENETGTYKVGRGKLGNMEFKINIF